MHASDCTVTSGAATPDRAAAVVLQWSRTGYSTETHLLVRAPSCEPLVRASRRTATRATSMTLLEEYFGPNAGYVADLFDRYQK